MFIWMLTIFKLLIVVSALTFCFLQLLHAPILTFQFMANRYLHTLMLAQVSQHQLLLGV